MVEENPSIGQLHGQSLCGTEWSILVGEPFRAFRGDEV